MSPFLPYLKRLGIEGEIPLLVETTADGAILLRPAAVYPIEIYDYAQSTGMP